MVTTRIYFIFDWGVEFYGIHQITGTYFLYLMVWATTVVQCNKRGLWSHGGSAGRYIQDESRFTSK